MPTGGPEGASLARYYRLIAESANEGIWLADLNGRTVYANARMAEILSCSVDELVGLPLYEFFPAERQEFIADQLAARAAGLSSSYETPLLACDGSEVFVQIHASPALDATGRIEGTLALVTDVTERARAEAALRESEARFRRLAENAEDVIYRYRLGPDEGWDYLSPAVERMTGYRAEDFYADPGLALRTLHPEDRPQHAGRGSAEQIGPRTFRLLHRDGRVLWIERRNVLVSDESGTPVAVEGIARDVTEAKRAEQALREREVSFRALFENAVAPMVVVGDDRRHLDANHAACELLGQSREELRDRLVDDFVDHDAAVDLEALWTSFRERGTMSGEIALLRPTGARRLVEFAATADVLPGRHLCVLLDVTERRELGERLQQVEKLEAIGQLASGVAHDFNNQLVAIMLACGVALDRLEPGHPARAGVEDALRGAEHAAALTRRLLGFARQQVLQPRPLDLNAAVLEAEAMLARLVGGQVTLTLELEPGLPAVVADPTQVEQVVVNLVVNARAALPSGGHVTISTARRRRDPDGATALPSQAARDEVCLSVRDDGVGMDAATRARVFEPFFTTKDPGEGTGLGLASVYGIVEGAGGRVWVESAAGAGSTFHVCLPAVDEPARPTARAAADRGVPPDPARPVTVLVVDDHDAVRAVMAETLETRGFTVVTAAGLAEALEVSDRHPGPIDVLLTDWSMPGGSGWDVARALRERRPALGVVYVSGGGEHAEVEREVAERSAAFLPKPFDATTLERVVRRAAAR